MSSIKVLRPLLSFSFLFHCCLTTLAEPSTGWKTGLSREDITPATSMWMSGYAARDHGSEGTRTRLWAKGLALEDARGNRALLITLDLVGVSRDVTLPVRNQIAAKHQLQIKDVLINCSHTHTGPVVGENLRTMYILEEAESRKLLNYTSQLKERLVKLADDAFENWKSLDYEQVNLMPHLLLTDDKTLNHTSSPGELQEN
jgi:neutral ceramidase